ncbi:GNAT family N-acetyltransferase [Marispirochaeta aestuarii]|uniref:GNAT family N-acetyltransferase n=1 Tax=Marispirochaeta aestuarii TaxID=1963862 RepID=UPI0029C8A085|nr:GNAT family N-acetyltransferase [Marispirochaeta aestuarii]
MIEPFSLGKEKEVHNLLSSVFNEFVGFEYTEEGNKVFNDLIKPENILERHKSGNIILTYEKNGRIIGIIEVRDNNHICLFFVDKRYHNKGIGRELFNEMLLKIEGKTEYLEINASPFSEEIYSRLGFKSIDNKKEINGILFIPMKMKL